jgi:O-antigen/teichoic acid export membrane protein
MPDLDVTTIAARSTKGIFALFSRSVVIFFIQFFAQLVLITLDPAVLGVFAVVQAVIGFLIYFSDIGLAAALIQKKDAITEQHLRTTFTIQQLLVTTVVLIAFFLTPVIASFYDLDKPGIFLYHALLISFFLSSLKSIPSVILERQLRFDKLVIPQVAEVLVFNIVAITFAFSGYGITSFSYAVLARGIVGVIIIYWIVKWKPAFGFDKDSAKKLLSFGFPFQTNSILALLKDNLLIIVLGKVLTKTESGFVFGFAQRWAYLPMNQVMDNVIRITFPTFSRLQHDKNYLKTAVEKTLFMVMSIISPLLFGLVVLSPYIIHIIPKYNKWEPALLSLAFFSGNALISSISTPLVNILNAIGKIKVTLYLMVFWTLTTWITTFFAIKYFGFQGVAIASFIVSLSVILVIKIAKQYVQFEVLKSIIPPLTASTAMAIVLYITAGYFVTNIFMLFVAILFGGAIYTSVLYSISKEEIKRDLATVRRQLKK